jgi:uncharacterized protein (DUF1499 family)/uncharacterized membrane protein YvlD (DUF360 family)
MFSRPTNPVSHRLARFAFVLACVASLTVAICGPVHRVLGVDLDFALTLFRYGFYAAAAAVALALATVVPTRPGEKRRGFVAAVLALAIGVAAAWSPAQWLLEARASPRINDVTTDTARPPAMVVTQQMRKGAVNPAAYPGESAAALQRAAYPDIVPVVLAVVPSEAFRRVDRVAMALGWDVVARAPAEGRLEAVDTTDWFGLQEDIVVRVRAEGTTGSRIDIRSKSRLGESDFGANARRIRAFMEQLRAEP